MLFFTGIAHFTYSSLRFLMTVSFWSGHWAIYKIAGHEISGKRWKYFCFSKILGCRRWIGILQNGFSKRWFLIFKEVVFNFQNQLQKEPPKVFDKEKVIMLKNFSVATGEVFSITVICALRGSYTKSYTKEDPLSIN